MGWVAWWWIQYWEPSWRPRTGKPTNPSSCSFRHEKAWPTWLGLLPPLISTSVNAPGEPPALSVAEAADAVESLGLGDGLLILDGGRLGPSPASTIVDCSGDQPVMLREGTVPLGRVRCVLPGVEAGGDG